MDLQHCPVIVHSMTHVSYTNKMNNLILNPEEFTLFTSKYPFLFFLKNTWSPKWLISSKYEKESAQSSYFTPILWSFSSIKGGNKSCKAYTFIIFCNSVLYVAFWFLKCCFFSIYSGGGGLSCCVCMKSFQRRLLWCIRLVHFELIKSFS